MHWNWPERRLHIPAGELARFDFIDQGTPGGGGLWRVEIGAQWHAALRKQTDGLQQGWEFERGCEGAIAAGGWTFHTSGRIDQFLPGPSPIVREIKTIHQTLPADTAELRERYRTHLLQLLIYQRLLLLRGLASRGELILIDIATGESQTIGTSSNDQALLDIHLQAIGQHLEERRSHFAKLRSGRAGAPFETYRSGQEAATRALDVATAKNGVTLFEAPTGFGKTGLALHAALSHLTAGTVDRILLLTAKNTGQNAYLAQLERFRKAMPELACHVLRSRQDLAIEDVDERAFLRQEILERWQASGLSAAALLADGPPSLGSLKSLARQTFLPATAISRFLLPYADVWIADFNYLFDPVVSSVLGTVATYAPERTFLVIDEAHTLPERVAASYSYRFTAQAIDGVLTELQFARFPGKLTRLLDALHYHLKRLRPVTEVDPLLESDLIGLLREIETALQESRQEVEDLSQSSLETLWELSHAIRAWDHPRLSLMTSIPARETFLLACLDASPVIGDAIQSFQRCLMMSATLQPWDAFTHETGLFEPPATVLGECDWLSKAYSVVVDARANTRFRARQSSRDITAHTIGQTTLLRGGPVAAFFPSYKYAELVRERLLFLYPRLSLALQPRDLPLEQQEAFLEQALARCDLLLLVVGGRFTEGIDALGGPVRTAIMVGPALPEFNPVQEARAALAGPRPIAFEKIYLIPGMRKVRQALGRLVRSPEHRAAVLLHCQRFAEAAYLQQLPPYLQPTESISNDADLDRLWLRPTDPSY